MSKIKNNSLDGNTGLLQISSICNIDLDSSDEERINLNGLSPEQTKAFLNNCNTKKSNMVTDAAETAKRGGFLPFPESTSTHKVMRLMMYNF